jgi:hypothetical protein
METRCGERDWPSGAKEAWCLWQQPPANACAFHCFCHVVVFWPPPPIPHVVNSHPLGLGPP